jgi:hypothetical protein
LEAASGNQAGSTGPGLRSRRIKTAVGQNDTSLSAAVASGGEVSVNGPKCSVTEEESMLDIKSSLLALLFSSWSVITVVLVGVLVYRGVLSSKEDDQIFVDAAEQHFFEEQQANITRMSRLNGPVMALSLASSVLFLTTVGVWIYRGYSSF